MNLLPNIQFNEYIGIEINTNKNTILVADLGLHRVNIIVEKKLDLNN